MVEIITILVIEWDICKRYTANTVLKDKTKFIPPICEEKNGYKARVFVC